MKYVLTNSAALIFCLGAIHSQAQEPSAPAAEVVMLAVPTVGETNALIGAINKARTDLGVTPLAVDLLLSERAANAFPEVIKVPGAVDVTALRKEFGANEVGVLRGIVTHRGVKSGAEFTKYWAKDPQWNAIMIADFTHIGAATVKRSDGKLVAFVYLIRK